jgi:Ca2+-binding EF-hand superfamily protein
VLSPTFEWAASVFVIINAVTIGIQTDQLARQQADWACNLVERGFICLFAVELGLRIAAEGVDFFLREGEQGWANILDGLVVVLQVFKEAVEFQSGAVLLWGSNSLGILRVFRVVRLIRVSNDARLFNILADLRTMVVSVSDSFLSLVWTVALLTLFTFVFAVFLTQLVADFVRLGRRAAVEEVALQRHFGSLQSTMLSLYYASTGGVNWHEIVDPLMYNFSPVIVVSVLCYMFFIIFSLTNVVTGVFVESALRTAEDDKRRQLTHQMTALFAQADDDGDGTVTWDEFEVQLAAPQLQSFLKALDLHVDEARALFQLLDVDDSGEIDADELVQGCLRLHGQAKAIELAAFMHEYRRTVRRAKVHEDEVSKSLSWICDCLAGQAQQAG